jgi:hypothetical protein
VSRPLEIVLLQLKRLGCSPTPCGEGWVSRCPGPDHEPGDGNRALYIAVDEGGCVILDCHGEHDAAAAHTPPGGVA